MLILICWIVFIGYWTISAFLGVKKDVGGRMVVWRWESRLLILAAVIILTHVGVFDQLSLRHLGIPTSPYVSSVGVLLCATGVALAIWARAHLGQNWGMPMSLKEKSELVTSGPYAYVRHPIYTGMILALLGSALVGDAVWLVPFVIFCVYFVYSAYAEERHMAQQFPEQYAAYKKRTKMFIPFVF
ncbi:MAG: methyltransferase family protein [Minisyncoccota bacterium]